MPMAVEALIVSSPSSPGSEDVNGRGGSVPKGAGRRGRVLPTLDDDHALRRRLPLVPLGLALVSHGAPPEPLRSRLIH
jgi:hypothetical protein